MIIFMIDHAPLPEELFAYLRAREGGQHRELRGGQLVALCELDRPREGVPIIPVQPQHEGTDDLDPGLVDGPDGRAHVGSHVGHLVGGPQVLLRQRLQAHEERVAAAPDGQGHQLRVLGEVEIALSHPAELQWDQRLEQLLGVRDGR